MKNVFSLRRIASWLRRLVFLVLILPLPSPAQPSKPQSSPAIDRLTDIRARLLKFDESVGPEEANASQPGADRLAWLNWPNWPNWVNWPNWNNWNNWPNWANWLNY